MNKAITDGVLFMPPKFEGGLDVWSSGDGTPGSDTYDNAVNAAFVPADQDFGGCLELLKSDSVQKLRYKGETPLLPGCYLRITARIKAVSGNLPAVRIAAWAGDGSNAHVAGLTETGPSTQLTAYGEVVEVSAIVGSGLRGGVDMVWGSVPVYGHFGLDLTGSNGGVVRIDDIEIEDITGAFHRDLMSRVDVKDFGAIGDGVADDAAAFEAADAAANGRHILVSAGTYFLGGDVTLDNPVTFEGTVTMDTASILSLTKSYHLPTYIAAFGDEQLGFQKAFQALLNNSDHESLDMGGRRVTITEPIDLAAVVPNRTEHAQRRSIANGQFYVTGTSAWDPDVVTSQASYSASNSRTLSNVVNAANIQVGSLVSGAGVGREIYVQAVNVATQEVTLSKPLYGAIPTQVYTFTRFKYVLDFSGFEKISLFGISDVEFLCNGLASAVMLAPAGLVFHVSDSYINRPRDRGITSIGTGCQGMLIDRCNFLSRESTERAQDRETIAINTNTNDVKLRNNRAVRFRHFAVMGGANSTITGNHFFQGDEEQDGVRTAGILLADRFTSTTIDGNYIDNCTIEWSNEYEAEPNFTSGFSFGALSVTDNVFLSGAVAPWFGYLVIKPHGTGHFITGLNVTGNKFRSINGTIDRVEVVDNSFASLNMTKGKNVFFSGNTYHNVVTATENPIRVAHDQNTAASTWTVSTGGQLPFGGRARGVDAVVATAPLKNASNVTVFTTPYVSLQQGGDGSEVSLHWETAVRGDVTVTVRMD